MEDSWNNGDRFGAIAQAIGRLPHDQTPLGLGFKLTHNPTTCVRCKADIASLELSAIIRMLENERVEEGVTIDN
jgi:hypothetical protein